jgi:hypothetical protein
MGAQRGDPTHLTLRQVRRILTWYARREAFEQRHGSVRDLAARLRIPLRTVYNYLSLCRRDSKPPPAPPRGRPRSLSRATVRRIIRWHDVRQRFLRSLGSSSELARDLGIKEPRIFDCVRRARRDRRHATGLGSRPSKLPTKRERQSRQLSHLLRAWAGLADQSHTPRAERGAVRRPMQRLHTPSLITRR